MTPQELTVYIDKLNEHNDYDLAWRYERVGFDAMFQIYEEADGHDLCFGSEDTIHEAIREGLEFWGLEDVND